MFKLKVDYPSKEEELTIVQRMGQNEKLTVNKVATPEDILAAREIVDEVKIHEKLQKYIVDIVYATRKPKLCGLDKLEGLIQYGASPRASIFLNKGAKALAFMNGRSYVTPQDIKTIGLDVLRHRVALSYEGEAQNLTSDDIIMQIFDRVDVP
jgi:MoxR-like ATPase